MPVNGWNIPPANNRRVRLPPPVFYLLRGRSTIPGIERSMEFAPMSEIVAHHKRIFIFRSCRKRPGIMAAGLSPALSIKAARRWRARPAPMA